jgi:polysaccharide export outer membrane protein
MFSLDTQRLMTKNILARWALVFASLFLITLVAPSSAQSLPGPSTSAPRSADASAPLVRANPALNAGVAITDDHYRLGTGDKIRVNVYGEEDLSGEFFVDSVGQVQLPLVGQVKAASLTVHEFVAEVTNALKEGYLKDPKVSVEVLNYRPFYIIGEVNKPGEYPFENGLNVLGAVALAGGYTYRANDSSVYVRRAGTGKEEALRADSSTRVYPGDIVRIAERIF